ncbi:MAG: immunity 8 family protein [Saprospiraceae bacterium]|nr:immunity 8 family protein [Saprospiraceae bacterium]
MIPKIKNLFSSDIDDLEKYVPEIADNFEVTFQLGIGSEGEKGVDIFQVTFCTPKWLMENCDEAEIFIPRHTLIVQKYDYPAFVEKVNKICQICYEKDWDECGLRLSRYFSWEFEDYNDYRELK